MAGKPQVAARRQIGGRRMNTPEQIYQRDDGRFQIGLTDEAAGPFESRQFAESVAAHEATRAAWLRRDSRHSPPPLGGF